MDKLQPVLRYKFWIIFGLTLPMILFAYYSASGKMTEATTTKEAALETARNSVPKGDSEPNETYAAGASRINEDLQQRFDKQVQRLWEMQTERMTWPKVVVPYIPNQYRGEIDRKARYTYMRVYPNVVQRLWERVQPFVGDSKTNKALADVVVDWDQKVIIDGQKIPHASFNMSLPISNKDMWDAQEDIWLLELIFDAVVRTNEDAAYVSDSPVRRIDEIRLVGGTGESSVTATASTSSSGSGDSGEAYAASMAAMGETGGMGGMGGFGQQLGQGAKVSVAFNVAEEFGPEVPEETGGDASSSSSSSGGEAAMAEYAMGMGGGAAPGAKMKRYIGAAGEDPFDEAYRERGFYMSVIILQDKIPDFFAELSSSPWPIRIGRFHIGPNPYVSKTPTSGRGFGGGGAGFGSEMEMGDYGSEADAGGFGGGGGFGSGGFGGGGSGFGQMGPTTSTLKLPDFMKLPSSIDPSLQSHPDLVQVDFCGIITMYNPIEDDSVEAGDDGSTEEDFAEVLESSPESPEEAAEMAAEEAAAPAPDATTPPADSAAPAAEPGTDALPVTPADPAATPPDSAAETPAQAPPADPSEANANPAPANQ